MAPCCKMTYAKYLNEDGAVDAAALAEELKKLGDERRAEDVAADPNLCRCACHVKGKGCLH